MAQKLFVGGIAYSTTSDGLREFFSQTGPVLSATVVTDRFSGQSRGFGFVEMETSEATDQAISQLNGRQLDGRKLTVQVSTPPTGGGTRGAGHSSRRGGWR
jgi:RNA recognition motif-containing protein